MSKPTISLAMIVRDSSATLERCLSSIKEAVQEIVIVDTGSVDNTVEIARKFTDKIYFFKWINDFSAARNHAFERCTGDFIIWLDSDDYVLPEDLQKIKDLDLSDKEIIICNYEYAHDETGRSCCTVPRERLLKRSLKPVWQDKIHEYLPLNGKLFISDISVHHNKQHGTSERNLKMLEDIVKKGPSSPRLNYYYGKEIFEKGGQDDEALIYFKKFVNDPNGFWEDRYQAYYKMATIYMNKGDEDKFKEHLYKSLTVEDRWAEPYCLFGLYYLNKQLWTKSILWYENAINAAQARPKDLLAYYQPEYYEWLPHLNLCLAYNNSGNIEKAYEHNKMVLFYRPNDSRALNNNRILESALKEKAKPVIGKTPGMNKRLNLGCGNKKMPGYTNVDIFKGPIVDEVFPFDEIPYLDGTIGAIHSEHALEHVPFRRAEQAIKEWFRVLAPGGELLLKIPDLDGCCRGYVDSIGDKYNRWWYKATIYGIQESQAGEGDNCQIHMCGFAQEELKEVLERNGFIVNSVIKYDGFRTPSLEARAIKPSPVKRVGWIAPENWEAAQTRIRVLRVNEWLNKEGHSSKIVGSYEEAISNNFDIVIVGKSFSEQDITGIKMLKEKGKTVYGDFCESLFQFPYFKETVEACDKVICCSEVLAEQCRSVNNNVTVIEDAWE